MSAERTRNDYPRRRASAARGDDARRPFTRGYRTTKRSTKAGKRLRRALRLERVRSGFAERLERIGRGIAAGVRVAVLFVAGGAAAIGMLLLIATGINALARHMAIEEAKRANSPEAVAERARDNVLIIATDETAGTDFLAVRLDQRKGQAFGIAIPDGAFMEVPGQGFERIGESFKAGSEVSLAAISNYLGVPFEHYVVIDKETYQAALQSQSLKGVFGKVRQSDLSPSALEAFARFADGLTTEQVALVPLPIKPVNVGNQTYLEPKREQVADLLFTWWGVRLGVEHGVVRVIVYNGAGLPAAAGQAAQELIKAGMRIVDTKNADRFDYKETLVICKPGRTEQAEKVREVLRTGRIVEQESEQDVADIIVIIGRDWTPAKG